MLRTECCHEQIEELFMSNLRTEDGHSKITEIELEKELILNESDENKQSS